MERNGSTTGGDDSNSKDIIHEDGVIDEFTLCRDGGYELHTASIVFALPVAL